MAFLTVTDIQSDLPQGFNSPQAARLLVKIESQLKRLGFVFDAVVETTRLLHADHFGQSIFDFGYARDVNTLSIKSSHGDNLFSFTSPSDYTIVEHPTLAGVFYRVELNSISVSSPSSLELKGKFGIYVDFDNVSSFESRLLRSSIVDYIIKYLSVYSSQSIQAANIKSAGTGESRVTYGDSSNSSLMNFKIEDDFDFSETLKHFVIPFFV